MPRKEDLPEVAAEEPVEVEIIDSPVTPEPDARKTAVIVAGGSTIPKAAISIVVQSQRYSTDEEGNTSVEVKKSHYPAGADVYLRYDPEVQFPKDAEVLTIGDNVQQGNFWGFTRQRGALNVGPAHPAYAGANLAYQMGATHIEIVGLTEAEKERLQVYFDRLPQDPVEPAQVAVSLT